MITIPARQLEGFHLRGPVKHLTTGGYCIRGHLPRRMLHRYRDVFRNRGVAGACIRPSEGKVYTLITGFHVATFLQLFPLPCNISFLVTIIDITAKKVVPELEPACGTYGGCRQRKPRRRPVTLAVFAVAGAEQELASNRVPTILTPCLVIERRRIFGLFDFFCLFGLLRHFNLS